MRGIRMRFEEQPGLCRKTRRRFPPSAAAWRSARKSPTPCSTPTTCCATPEGTERQEEDVAQHLGGLQGVSADNAHGVIRPSGRSGCRRAPGPPESLAGLATAPGFSSPTRLHVAEHRLQAEQAGIAQGAQFGSRRMPARISMPRSGSARRRACSSSLARPARALAPTGGSAALDGMQGRGAALDIALAELAFELGEEVLHVRNEAPQHLDDQPCTAETPDDIAPRLDQFARVRCRCRRALAPLLPR